MVTRDATTQFSKGMTTAAPNFDHFTWENVIMCRDGTICPSPKNQSCCDQEHGRVEINYHNNATVPSERSLLSSYYADGGYMISASLTGIPSTNASVTGNSVGNSNQGNIITTSKTPSLMTTITSAPETSSIVSATSMSSMAATHRPIGISPGGNIGVGVFAGIGIAALAVAVTHISRRHAWRRLRTQSPT